MIVGLGAGLLPMFVHNHIPIDSIQVLNDRPSNLELGMIPFSFTMLAIFQVCFYH